MVKRYVLVKVMSQNSVSSDQFNDLLTQSVRKSFGEIGFIGINPKLIRFNPEKAEAIVACERSKVMELQAALALATDTLGAKVALITLRVSGTIKGLRQKRQSTRRKP
jgi:RNase P/RNase MRP subunit POP5